MRFRSPFATAVALAATAVAFSAAFRSAEATQIVIDNFQISGSTSNPASGFSAGLSLTTVTSGSFGGLLDRNLGLNAFVFAPSGQGSVSIATGSGVGTIAFSSPGIVTGFPFSLSGEYAYSTNSSTVDWAAGGNNTLRIVTGTVTTSNVGPLTATVYAGDSSTGFEYTLPGFWASNQTYDIPFASFPGVDFSQISSLIVGFSTPPAATEPGSAYSGSIALTNVSVVPEPQGFALMGTAGAAMVCGMIRRRRIMPCKKA